MAEIHYIKPKKQMYSIQIQNICMAHNTFVLSRRFEVICKCFGRKMATRSTEQQIPHMCHILLTENFLC